MIAEVENGTIADTELVTEIEKESSIVQLEKEELHKKFIPIVKERMVAEFLSKDDNMWPTLAEVNDELNASKQKKDGVKAELEDEKENITMILEKVSSERGLLQDKVKKLKEKLEEFEIKKSRFESLFHIKPAEAKHSIDNCRKIIQNIKMEINERKSDLQTLNASIKNLKQEAIANKKLKCPTNHGVEIVKRALKISSFMEMVTGAREHPAGHNQILLEFFSDQEGFSCYLTLTLRVNCHGDYVLFDAKTDSPHLVIKDLLDFAIAKNNIPYLVRSVQDRWLQRFPMLSELDSLSENHFVDWIEERGLLRVLVGKNGKLFTLQVPQNYPASRDITLVDLYRLQELHESELPDKSSSLTDWVVHLETKFADQEM